MVPVHCPSPHSHLSINQVSFKCQKQFKSYFPDKVPDGRTDKETTIMLPPLGSIKIKK